MPCNVQEITEQLMFLLEPYTKHLVSRLLNLLTFKHVLLFVSKVYFECGSGKREEISIGKQLLDNFV